MTDQDLLFMWVSRRDPEAFGQIVRRHAGMVYATCRRVLGSSDEAEDACQETFEALVKVGARPGAYLPAWLHRVAVNRALTRLRSQARQKSREATYASGLDSPEAEAWDEAYEQVDAAINELPERLRACVVMHFLEGRTHEVIAQDLGVARTTVSARIAQGVDRIRESLRRKGLALAAGTLAGLAASGSGDALPSALTSALGRLSVAAGQLTPGGGSAAAVLGNLFSLKAGVALITVVVLGAAAWRTVSDREPIGANAEAGQAVVQTQEREAAAQVQHKVTTGRKPGRVARPSGRHDSSAAPQAKAEPALNPVSKKDMEKTLQQPCGVNFEDISIYEVADFISEPVNFSASCVIALIQ